MYELRWSSEQILPSELWISSPATSEVPLALLISMNNPLLTWPLMFGR